MPFIFGEWIEVFRKVFLGVTTISLVRGIRLKLKIVFLCMVLMLMASATYASENSVSIGTREDPVPIGTAADIGDGWQIKVLEVYPNANEMVAQENQFNSPPKEWQQFFIARIELTYKSSDSAKFNDKRLRAVGPSSVIYSTFGNSPGVIPDKLGTAEAFTGGKVIGNIGWAINSSDADKLVMYDSDASKDNRKFMALYK